MRLRDRVTGIALLWALAYPAVQARADDLLDRVLATVEGRVITLSDVRTAQRFGFVSTGGSADATSATLDRLIDRLVILAEVERYAPPEPDPEAVRRAVAEVHARVGSEDAVAGALRVAGLDEAALVQRARNDLRIAQYLQERFAGAAEPTDEDVESYVRRHEADLRAGGRPLDDSEVRRLARERVAAERHDAVVREWVQGLRDRAGVSTTPAQ